MSRLKKNSKQKIHKYLINSWVAVLIRRIRKIKRMASSYFPGSDVTQCFGICTKRDKECKYFEIIKYGDKPYQRRKHGGT